MTTFLRAVDIDVDEKAEAICRAITLLRKGTTSQAVVFESDPAVFAKLPGSPFAYWVHDAFLRVFLNYDHARTIPREAKNGLGTLGDFRFVRLATEVPLDSMASNRWIPFSKGGRRSPFYQDVKFAVQWSSDGAEVKAHIEHVYQGGHWSRNARSVDWYFRPGITWPLRGVRFSAQAVPQGGIFSVGGKMLFSNKEYLLPLLAILNSRAFDRLLALFAGKVGGVQYESGLIERTPVPDLCATDVERLSALARKAWSLRRSLDSTNEVSHAFLLPPGLNEKVTGLDRGAIERELESLQQQIDESAYELYGITADDRASLEASSTLVSGYEEVTDLAENDDASDASGDDAPLRAAGHGTLSWLVGVAFGRFDPRLATGVRACPPEPEPFDVLPSRSPGMWPDGEEPADRPDILVDDEGHPDDIFAHARAVADHVHVDTPDNFRSWLAREFFQLHIRMYSKSSRKAPIYWQLATPSASYSVWLYVHAFSKDTLFRVQNDYVAPKLAHEERRLEVLTSGLRDGGTAAQRKALAAHESFVEELRTFLDEVRRIAPLWNPNLDDGVIINFAPLWRLVPQNKPWQKELKSTWDALCEGKYDWAHLAMHLWPERVVRKCAKDRSLAIAHGLGDVFLIEGPDGKWAARKTPTRSLDELVRERSSPAVKSALKSLLDAPAVSGGAGRGNGGGRRRASGAAQREDL